MMVYKYMYWYFPLALVDLINMSTRIESLANKEAKAATNQIPVSNNYSLKSMNEGSLSDFTISCFNEFAQKDQRSYLLYWKKKQNAKCSEILWKHSPTWESPV